MKIALYCVGNKLMLDDGLGCAVFDELQAYEFPEYVNLFDVGCMSMDLLGAVDTYDLIITVDAVDGTGEPAGTIFSYAPEDMAGRPFGSQSLHDLKLSDLFESAELLGYHARGLCLGMQIANGEPGDLVVGLTPAVNEKLPDLVDCVLAALVKEGVPVRVKATGAPVVPGYHHQARA